ncbi:MAG: DNA-directed RNA polymerase subunit beta' [bacterium]
MKSNVQSEITVILTRAQEKSYLRETFPLDLVTSLLSKKEYREPVTDPQTGELLASKGDKVTYLSLLRLIKSGTPVKDIEITDKKTVTTLEKALVDRLRDEEIADDLKDPSTDELVAKAETSLDNALWDILLRYRNDFPIKIANKEAKKSYRRAKEKKIKEIREIVEGLEALHGLRPYRYLEIGDEGDRGGSYILDGVTYRNLMKLRAVIRKRATTYTPEDLFIVDAGAEAIYFLLKNMKLAEMATELRKAIKVLSPEKAKPLTTMKADRLMKRLNMIENIIKGQNKPEWMILQNVPVIPPDLRPMVQLEGGRHATSDLNELYRLVITRNNRLQRLMRVNAPESIIRNEKRILQEAVDGLLDNSKKTRPLMDSAGRPLKSLADALKGKQGRFRQNLLGKRVDYSGRAVVVVGPRLHLWQCGIPRIMALELFKPFVIKELIKREAAQNIKAAKRLLERVESLKPQEGARIWECLEEAIRGKVVMLNRAPTLHRLGIQAFEPVLVDGEAILLHPLVCSAFNADFDGDQMAVHLPLSIKAQVEARLLMLASRNLLLPADGLPVSNPSHDMVLGLHYITLQFDTNGKKPKYFPDMESVERAYANGHVKTHDRVLVRVPTAFLNESTIDARPYTTLKTSVGRVLFNLELPAPMRFVNEVIDKKNLKRITADCYRLLGEEACVELLDNLKDLGFVTATRAGISIGVVDAHVPPEKKDIVARAEHEMEKLEEKGLHLDRERWVKRVTKIWGKAVDEVGKAVENDKDLKNSLLMMVKSGSRGNMDQLRQLAGMRGLMADPSGRIIPMPIKASFREGLTVHEYFISTHGGRKGLTDTALRTAKSGYLTRQLVDLAQEIFISEEDCGTQDGIELKPLVVKPGEVIEGVPERALGRFVVSRVLDYETGEVIVPPGNEIVEDALARINHFLDADGYFKTGRHRKERIKSRSSLTCESKYGVCAKCYGRSLATGRPVEIGEPVGVVAAQAIGEPGTQLTLRTFHTGGIAGGGTKDITQGLPLAEMFFEVYQSRFHPKREGAVISPCDGYVESIQKDEKAAMQKTSAYVVLARDDGEQVPIEIPPVREIIVKVGDTVNAGDALTDGYRNPMDLLTLLGPKPTQSYLIDMVQSVYRSQGVNTNDKHFEIIIMQMMKFMRVKKPGETEFLTDTYVNKYTFSRENERLKKEGKEPASGELALLGVKKAAINSESYLSAASFQETARVLSAAALEGKKDFLRGLKENIVLGREIPAGTGFPIFKDADYNVPGGTRRMIPSEKAEKVAAAVDTAKGDDVL